MGSDQRGDQSGVSPETPVLVDDGIPMSPQRVCNVFNEHFCSVASNLVRNLPPVDIVINIPECNNSCNLTQTNFKEIYDILISFRNKRYHINEIQPSILDGIFNSVGHVLVYIFNLSMRTGTYPSQLKLARVIPVHKSGDTTAVNNYRPISNLSIFNKLLEKVLYRRLLSHLSLNNSITENQFGFCKGKQTSLAIFYFMNDILSSLNKKFYTVALFLDLKKAFDSVDHEILLQKLRLYGIRGPFNDLIRSYLTNRSQYVFIDDYKSDILSLKAGVPQGSVLGPLLFNVFINDISSISRDVKFKLYADDAVFYISGEDYEIVCGRMQEFLNNLTVWLVANKLVAHETKTKLMCFTNRTIDNTISIRFNDVSLEWVSQYKYLGLIIDRELNFSPAINALCLKLNRLRGILYAASKILPVSTLKVLYYSFVYQSLIQNIIIWGGAANCHVNKVRVALNKILRTILKVKYNDFIPLIRTGEMYQNLDVLPLNQIYELFLLKFFHKASYDDPVLFNQCFAPLIPSHNYPTTTRFNFPAVRLNVEKSFTVFNCIKLVNNLPEILLESANTGTINKRFKHYVNSILYGNQ